MIKEQLVRSFSLGSTAELAVGFSAQSPAGDGCTAVFDDMRFARCRLGDLRTISRRTWLLRSLRTCRRLRIYRSRAPQVLCLGRARNCFPCRRYKTSPS